MSQVLKVHQVGANKIRHECIHTLRAHLLCYFGISMTEVYCSCTPYPSMSGLSSQVDK